MTTLIRARVPIAGSMATGPILFADPVPATAQFNFSASRAASVVDQTGNGHSFTDIGKPSWTANGMQVNNASIGVQTDIAETPSMTYVAIACVPAGVGLTESTARPVGTLRGFGAASIGASMQWILSTAANTARFRVDVANRGAVLSTPELQTTYDTRTALRFVAMTIDAIAGTVSMVMPRYDWHEQRVVGNSLGTRPLNGNVLIGAYSNPGDGGQQGACVIRRIKIWQNRALNFAEVMAEYRLALQDFASIGLSV